MGSAHENNCPKYIKAANQAEARVGFSNKGNRTAIFDKLEVRNFSCDIDGE